MHDHKSIAEALLQVLEQDRHTERDSRARAHLRFDPDVHRDLDALAASRFDGDANQVIDAAVVGLIRARRAARKATVRL